MFSAVMRPMAYAVPVPTLRILGGTAKGRVLQVPETARPTGARLRKSLFDLLIHRYPRGRFLDLYAGSGGVGLEAASRGYDATLVDIDAGAVKALERNARTIGVRARVLRGDARSLLPRLGEHDVVFVDPPYDQDIPTATRAVLETGTVAGDGVLIVQHPTQLHLTDVNGYVLERRVYGSNVLTLYTHEE